MHEAMFYEQVAEDRVRCHLCPHECRIRSGQRGICRVRANEGGVLYTLNYGWASPLALDPMEKKPLYHFYPGHTILSTGSRGCNFHCEFCQNWQLAHGEDPLLVPLSPQKLVSLAVREKERGDCVGIAYTYSEPLMWYEFVLDAAMLAREKGLKNVMVSNGFVQEEPLHRLLPYIDAWNVDVKGFREDYYRRIVHGKLEPVLETCRRIKESGSHLEITTLLVPGLNDSSDELEALTDFVVTLGKEVPLHFSRYFPHYKMSREPTPISSLVRAREIALKKLQYVYLGNVELPGSSDTRCPSCGETVIRRSFYHTRIVGLRDDRTCRNCGYKVYIVG